MILIDASIWIDHFRSQIPALGELLARRRARLHPFTFGELALGHVPDRARTLVDLSRIRPPLLASHTEALRLLETNDLHAKGIGYVDLHLLASAKLDEGVRLWTRDRRLAGIAEMLGVGVSAEGYA